MKNVLILFAVLIVGCADSEDNASTNLRKGDEFFVRGEFEIAEYYYDKIPEESILRKTVVRRKKDIEKNIGSTVAKASSEKKAEEVTIASHTFKVSLGRIPMHTITLLNSTSKKLQMVDVEFTYFNAAGNEITKLTSNIFANLDKNEEKEFKDLAPGMVGEKIASVKVSLKRPLFF